MNNSERIAIKNKKHYDAIYDKVNVAPILNKLNDLESFMREATRIHTSWHGLYHDNFEEKLNGKIVLELGCGDCTNAAVMAALGAKVYANDISPAPGRIIEELNKNYDFPSPIKFIKGDFLKSDLTHDFYDIVIGKAFIHHLTHDQELAFTKKIVQVLKSVGMVRYFEPAVNSKLLDELRLLTPTPGRPSKIQRAKFKKWKIEDPHPERDNSSRRYKMIGEKYFEFTKIHPVGTIERFYRILPNKFSSRFRRFAFRAETYLPKSLNLLLSRSQLVEYRNPKK